MKPKSVWAWILAVLLLPWAGMGAEEPPGGSVPAVVQHWVTQAISDDGLKRYSGDLELFLLDDGSAYVRFLDYNVKDYDGTKRGTEYQEDAEGELYKEYGLYYTWKRWGPMVWFSPMEAEAWRVDEENELRARNVREDTRPFTIHRGTLQWDGTLHLAFAFTYLYEDGWDDPRKDYFILAQSGEPGQPPGIATRAGAEAEQAEILGLMEETEAFCRGMMAAAEEPLARFERYQLFEGARGSALYALNRGKVLYGGGAAMAVVHTGLYPEYAESGAYALADGARVTVLRRKDSDFALVYLSGQRPGAGVLGAFQRARKVKPAAERGALRDFYYNYGSEFPEGYELLDMGLVSPAGEGKALLYVQQGSGTAPGYPVEVPAGALDELAALLEAMEIQAWAGSHEPEDWVTDGYGFYLAAAYAGGTLTSEWYHILPEGYQEGHEAIVAFFEELCTGAKENKPRERVGYVMHARVAAEEGPAL